jgi:hypothetical protein
MDAVNTHFSFNNLYNVRLETYEIILTLILF